MGGVVPLDFRKTSWQRGHRMSPMLTCFLVLRLTSWLVILLEPYIASRERKAVCLEPEDYVARHTVRWCSFFHLLTTLMASCVEGAR